MSSTEIGTAPASPGTDIAPDQRVVRFEIIVSAVRCLLTYVLIPVAAPVLGFTSVQKEITTVLSIVALGCIAYSIRRFFRSNHRMRWPYAVISGGLAVYLIIEVVREIIALTR